MRGCKLGEADAAILHQCFHCGQLFSDKKSLKSHERKHIITRDFKCGICSKEFKRKKHLDRHEKLHRGEKPFSCTYCGRTFDRSDYLTVHVRIHTGEKPYMCRYCGKRFTQENSMSLHERTHTGDRRFKCSFCDKLFMHPHHKVKHERIHTGEKPYMCCFCDKRFSRMEHMKRHERVHTGEKPYRCSFCDKQFSREEHMKRHEKGHIPDVMQLRVNRSLEMRYIGPGEQQVSAHDVGEGVQQVAAHDVSEGVQQVAAHDVSEVGVQHMAAHDVGEVGVQQVAANNGKEERMKCHLQSVIAQEIHNAVESMRESDKTATVATAMNPAYGMDTHFTHTPLAPPLEKRLVENLVPQMVHNVGSTLPPGVVAPSQVSSIIATNYSQVIAPPVGTSSEVMASVEHSHQVASPSVTSHISYMGREMSVIPLLSHGSRKSPQYIPSWTTVSSPSSSSQPDIRENC